MIMKKQYMTPSMEVTKIHTIHMLASSPLDTSSETPQQDDFNETTDETGNNLSRQSLWDDEE